MISAEEKAKELVNMYYAHAKTQEEAIQMADNAILTSICQKIDELHENVVIRNDMDKDYVKPSIKILKWWQSVACEVSRLKSKLPV